MAKDEKLKKKQIADYKTGEVASSRAIREASSAPITEEILIYKNWLKKAINNQKEPKILILGATPELRDIALDLKCRVFSVDISFLIFERMTQVMKKKWNEREVIINGNWLDLDKYFKEGFFDAIMGDVSLSNTKADDQKKLLKIIYKLLKPAGYFISRCDVFLPERKIRSFKEIHLEYLQGKNTWLGFIFEYSWYGPHRNKIYDIKTSITNFNKAFHYLLKQIKTKKPQFKSNDFEKIKNVTNHAKNVVHTIFPKKIFEEMLKKYFKIIEVEKTKYILSDWAPIYILKKK